MSSFFIKKIELSGIICKKNKESIWIVPDNLFSLNNVDCKVGCGACSGGKNKKRVRIYVEDTSQLKCGERISISTIQLNEAIAAMIVFGLPIFLMLLSFFVWYMLNPANINSLKVILSSILAFIISFIIIKEIDLILRKKYPVTLNDIKRIK